MYGYMNCGDKIDTGYYSVGLSGSMQESCIWRNKGRAATGN